MIHITLLNFMAGLLSFASAASIIYAMLKDKKGKTPLFSMLVLIICSGNALTGLHRMTQAFSFGGDDILHKFLNWAYPINDLFLIISGFILSYMISAYHLGDIEIDPKDKEEQD